MSLLDLRDELLAEICQLVGAKTLQPSARASSRLHHAWQSIVTSIASKSLPDDEDLQHMKKYVNLQKLRLSIHSKPGSRPAWSTIAELAAPLAKLVDLSLVGSIAAGCRVLQMLATTEALKMRLQRLSIMQNSSEDVNITLGDDEFYALSVLKQLSVLELHFDTIDASEAALRECSEQLALLTKLKLQNSEHEDIIIANDKWKHSIFPGACTSLVSLCLLDTWMEDEIAALPAVYLARQLQLVAAVSSLVNLQHLDTNYPLFDLGMQKAALTPLTQLTCLRLIYATDVTCIKALDDLPALKKLTGEMYCVPMDAVLRHKALTCLDVARLEPAQQEVAGTGSQLADLMLRSQPEGTGVLEALPKLPCLIRFGTSCRPTDDGRHLGLAAMLRRQADTLQVLSLLGEGPFQEVLQCSFERCTKLQLLGCAVSTWALQLLSTCSWPSLEWFRFQVPVSMVHPATDLAWLRSCAKLSQVQVVHGMQGQEQVAGALKEALQGMLPAAAVVEVDKC